MMWVDLAVFHSLETQRARMKALLASQRCCCSDAHGSALYWEWPGVFAGLVVNTLLIGRALSFVPSFIDNVVFIVSF